MKACLLMIARIAVGVAAIAGMHSAWAQEPELQISRDLGERTVSWNDLAEEAGYRVHGTIEYLHFRSCVGASGESFHETVNVDKQLPADTASFALPAPAETRADSIKEIQITVEALDAGGAIIAANGFATTVDKFCSEAEIAAELAAAGGGPAGVTSRWRLPAALAAMGALLLSSGVALRKAA